MARKREVGAKELLRIDKALRGNPGPEEIRTTVTDRTLIAIRSSSGRAGSASGSYTIRHNGDAQVEIFSGSSHLSWPCEVREGDRTRMIVASIRAALVDYLDEVVGK